MARGDYRSDFGAVPVMIPRFRTRPQSLADDELVVKVAKGDPGAFEALYDRHERPAYSLALRLLASSDAAEDVVHDAFVAIWQRVENHDPTRGPFRTWLLTIIHGRSIARLRSPVAPQQGAPRDGLGVLSEIVAGADRPPAGNGAQASPVGGDLATLPPEQREAVALAYFGGLTHSEIAECVETSLGTAKGRIRLGMQGLRDRIAAAR